MAFPGRTRRRLVQLVIKPGAMPLLLVYSGRYDTQFQVATVLEKA
jgi:hypothetical protein